MQFWIYAGRTSWGYLVSHSLNFSNRRMRTRLSGGVAGVEGETLPPYADPGPLVEAYGCVVGAA
jgi:hypothetical protein